MHYVCIWCCKNQPHISRRELPYLGIPVHASPWLPTNWCPYRPNDDFLSDSSSMRTLVIWLMSFISKQRKAGLPQMTQTDEIVLLPTFNIINRSRSRDFSPIQINPSSEIFLLHEMIVWVWRNQIQLWEKPRSLFTSGEDFPWDLRRCCHEWS